MNIFTFYLKKPIQCIGSHLRLNTIEVFQFQCFQLVCFHLKIWHRIASNNANCDDRVKKQSQL